MIDWNSLLSPYHADRFWCVAVDSVLIGTVAFLLFAGLLTWIAASDPAWARRWRIQNARGGARLDAHEAERRGILIGGPHMIRRSLAACLRNNLWMLAATAASWPLMSLTGIRTDAPPALWLAALQLLGFVYLDDFLYYWMHRAMHSRWLLKHVHGVHHRVMSPWAVTGHYMHPVEYVATGSVMFIGPALLGCHVYVLWAWVILRQWEAAEGHCGYAFPWSPTHWLPFSHGALHHDYHHAKIRGNYGGFLPVWDRVFGTLISGYGDEVARHHNRPTRIENA